MESQPEDQPGADVKIDLQSLKDFENAILKVLDDLTQGDIPVADPVSGQIYWSDFGTWFDEAYGMALSSTFTIEKIKQLAKMVHQQIEAMALTVKMAGDSTVMADEANQAKLSKLLYGKFGEEPFDSERAPAPAVGPVSSASGQPASAPVGAPGTGASTGG